MKNFDGKTNLITDDFVGTQIFNQLYFLKRQVVITNYFVSFSIICRQFSRLQKQSEEEFPCVFHRQAYSFLRSFYISCNMHTYISWAEFVWQFGNCGSLEQHGFARNRMWAIDENPPPLPGNDSSGKSFIDLVLKSSEEDMKCWPHRYE